MSQNAGLPWQVTLMIVLLTKDLFFVPTVKSAAKRLRQNVLVISSSHDRRLEHADTTDIAVIIVDLSALSVEGLDEVYQQLRELAPNAVLCAFASHMHPGRIEKAKHIGFEPVITRGVLNKRLAVLLAEWTGG